MRLLMMSMVLTRRQCLISEREEEAGPAGPGSTRLGPTEILQMLLTLHFVATNIMFPYFFIFYKDINMLFRKHQPRARKRTKKCAIYEATVL